MVKAVTMQKRKDTAADGYGADWHPSAKTQANRAEVLTAHLKTLLDNGTIK